MSGYYHLSVSIISRSAGRSVVACAAYRAGQMIEDDRYGKTYDYHRRRGITDTGIETPKGSPVWAKDRGALWNAVEAGEKRKDAQLAREFIVGFPHQLNSDERREVLLEFIHSEFTSMGLIADWAIHAPNREGDERNWHAHIMTTMRHVSEHGFDPKKDRELNRTERLEHWREVWAEMQNRLLRRQEVRKRTGVLVQVDHRSYALRGWDIEPMQHLGVHATALERRGIKTERGDLNRYILLQNVQRSEDVLHKEEPNLLPWQTTPSPYQSMSMKGRSRTFEH